MNEEHELAAWYKSAERENVTEDLTVTHVHTTDGTVTLSRDWLAVKETQAEWEPIIKVLYDAADSRSESPLGVPVNTAVGSLVDAGLVRGGSNARQRARALLALLQAEEAIDFNGEAVVIPFSTEVYSYNISNNKTFAVAKYMELEYGRLSNKIEEYCDRLEEIGSEIEKRENGDEHFELIQIFKN